MRRLRRWQRSVLIIVAIIVFVPIIVFIVLGLLPAPSDPPVDPIIVGAPATAGSVTGIVTDFPAISAESAGTDAQRALGRLLFFDPILSASKTMACATCHHPDLGFSDGLPTGKGVDVLPLKRNVPTLYEVAYYAALYWDGRAPDLELQMLQPLTTKNEMGNSVEQIVRDLTANAEYTALFAAAFPGQPTITMAQIQQALAAFERSLTAHDTPFDRYAKGDFTALTASQRRGFALFRSGATGCYNCHAAPTFADTKFAVTGVPDAGGKLSDTGRNEATGYPEDVYAFKIPTLRNVALTAPYMHNGRFTTLEEVVDFYMKGGGKGMGIDVPNQSRFVRPFELNDQERQDLINFLYALTDESGKPVIPDQVPSGLPVITARTNALRERAAAINAGAASTTKRPATTLTVKPGDTIQSVVDQAQPGDTIEISYAVYRETVLIDLSDITMRGIPNAAGELPMLDGEMQFANGIAASGNNFTVEKLSIKNYRGNGIIVDGVTGVTIRDIYVENTSLYGVYPVHSTGVLVERVKATRIRDAGVYAGQCRDVIIRNNEVYENVIGIEVENSINAEIYGNYAYNNSTGIFIDLLPQLPSKVSLQTKVYNNRLENNNLRNFANEGEIGALVPEGTGILVLGADEVDIYGNTISGNRTVGVAVFSTAVAFDKANIDMPPNPEQVHVHGNTFSNNGYDAAKTLTDLGISGKDIVWDVSNWNNRFDEPNATSFPPLLPSSGWPDLFRKSYWQVLNFVIRTLG